MAPAVCSRADPGDPRLAMVARCAGAAGGVNGTAREGHTGRYMARTRIVCGPKTIRHADKEIQCIDLMSLSQDSW